MPANIYTLAVASDGWTGSVAVTAGGVGTATVNVPAGTHTSPYRIAASLQLVATAAIGQVFTWSVLPSGALRFTNDPTAVSIAFTGNVGAGLGFSSASYSAAATHTAEAAPPSAFTPHADAEGLFYALDDSPIAGVKGIKTPDGGLWLHCPATDHRRPVLRLSMLRAAALRFREAWAHLGTPAEVDVPDTSESSTSPSVVTLTAGRLQSREASELSGFSEWSIEVLR